MNKLLNASLAGLALTASALHAQIEINDNLSVTGFLDLNATNTSSELTDTTKSTFNLDQAEVDFLLNFDQVSGRIDLNYLGENDTGEFDLEQAYLTYDLDNGGKIDAGKYETYMGFEALEPTGLYQISTAYDLMPGVRPTYQNGVRYTYSDDFVSMGLSLVDSIYDADGSIGDSEYGIEAKIGITPVEGWTVFLGFAKDAADQGMDKDLINFWTSYEVGNATYALELVDYEINSALEGSQMLLMANYGLTDKLGVTLRFSEDEIDGIVGNFYNETVTKYTLSPNYTINDNLGILFEISQSDYGREGDETFVGLETIFTF